MNSKIINLKVLILDVDGVLTNGQIVYDNEGREIKFYDVQDGLGIVMLHKFGIKTAIISARHSDAVEGRAKDLGISRIALGAFPKTKAFEDTLKDFNITPDEACFIGDDLPDLPLLKQVGFAVAVDNAHPEVKKIADYVTNKSGGYGAVREVCELILKVQGKWDDVIALQG